MVAGFPAWTAVGGTGTVTSVALAVNGAPTLFSITGSPVTTAGSLTLNVNAATGDILYASSTNNLARLAVGTNGQVLTLVSGLPAWSSVGAGTVSSVGLTLNGLSAFLGVSGTPVTTSGTLTVNVTATTGDMLYASSTNTISRLAVGSNTQILTIVGGVPTWAAPANSGTVTSVGLSLASGLTGFLGVTGTPVTTSGTLSLTVTATAGDILYASATNTLSRLAVGSNGQVLTLVSGFPAWQTISGTGTVTSVGLSMPADFSVANSPVTTTGTLTVTRTTQSALNMLGGPNTPNGAAVTPTYKNFDRTALFGGWSGLRALPTTGAISGDYYNNGNWTQTGAITSTNVRVYNAAQ